MVTIEFPLPLLCVNNFQLDNKKKEIELLAARIKDLRIKKGYSNYESFAFDNEIPRAQYGRYEKGEDLKFSSLIKIIKALDITLEEFFSKGFEDI